jgi:glucose/arabinose dehydrogenase
VVRLPLGGTPNPVLTGIPHGTVHNGGGLLFSSDGHLLVGTGDTGKPALAADPRSLAGKVLQVDVFGHPAGSSPVFSRGFRNVTALCQGAAGALLATDAVAPDELDAVARGKDYAAAGTATFSAPAAEAGFGGCAVAGTTVFVGALAGKRVDAVHLDAHGAVTGSTDKLLPEKYGRLRSVAVDPNGGVWVTTSNRDGIGTPGKDDDKVLRILPPSAQSNSPL